ncbi:MAG TPA: hypothetical protein VHD90_07005 [Phototrophicaceae bacterium]|nr:hypothetical protein [Phototrophicaceae bacterium]
MKRLITAVALISAFAAPLVAQATQKPPTPALPAAATNAAPKVPELTEVNKLKLQNALQRMELAQLRAQAAQSEFDAARTEASVLVQGVTVDGFDLDLRTLTYVPKAVPVVPPITAPTKEPATGRGGSVRGGYR